MGPFLVLYIPFISSGRVKVRKWHSGSCEDSPFCYVLSLPKRVVRIIRPSRE